MCRGNQISYLLFENSIPLISLTVAVLLLTLFVFKNISEDIKKRVVIVSVVLIPTFFILEKMVDTDKEIIFKEISKIAQMIKSKPITELSYFFEEDIIVKYKSKEYNSEEYIEWLEEKLIDKQIKDIKFKTKKFSVKDNKNQVMIVAVITIITQDGVFRFPIKFKTIWKRDKIINIDFDVPLINKGTS